MNDKLELIQNAIKDNEMFFVKPSNQQFYSKLQVGKIYKDKKTQKEIDKRTKEGKYFNNYFELLFEKDKDVRKSLLQQDGKKSNYRLTEGYLDVSYYKNDYTTASLFGVTNKNDWDKLFVGEEYIQEKKFSLLVFEPNMNYSNKSEFDSGEKTLNKMKKTFGIINQGDQFTIVELNANQKKRIINGKNKVVPRYTISEIVDTFKKPNELLNSNDGLVYTKTNKKKIVQSISTIGNDGTKIYDNADTYEIMKNFILGAFSAINGDYLEKNRKIEHIRRIVSSNQENIDSVSSVAFFTANTSMSSLGMSSGAYFNTNSKYLTFGENIFSEYLNGLTLKTKSEKEIKTKLYNFFKIEKNGMQSKIINEMLADKKTDYIYYSQSPYNSEIITPEINIKKFISEYQKKVAEKIKYNSSYYLINTDTNDINLKFMDKNFDLSFNTNSFFTKNKIGEKRIIERYQLTNDKINALFGEFSLTKNEFENYIKKYDSDFVTEIKNMFLDNKSINLKKLFNITSSNGNANEKDRLLMSNIFKNVLEEKYSKVFGFSSYSELIKESKNYNIPLLNLDLTHINGLLNNNYHLNSLLTTTKQTANIRGKMLNISQSFLDILGHQNITGQRASQGGDKFSGAILKLDNGVKLDFAEIISSWQKYDETYNTKVVNDNYEAYKKVQNNFYSKAVGNDEFETNLYSKYGTILYTNTDYSFQDSNISSNLNSMKNTSMYDNKNIFLPYDAISSETINEMVEKFELDSASGFYNKISNFDNSKILDENSFENFFMKKLLGEENFSKYINARYDSEGNVKNIAEEFKNIGVGISTITDVQTIEDKKRLIKEIDISVSEYNNFIEKYMIKSTENGKMVNILDENFAYKGLKRGISGSNYAFIEGINFENDGIRINTKGIVLNSQGTKTMYDNIKATNQIGSNLITLVDDGHTYVIDAILNEKMTKSKRGFNGTFYGRSILTMALHGINQNFSDNNIITKEEKFNKFLEIIKSKSKIEINGKTTDVLELLGIELSYNNGTLNIGEIDKKSSKFVAKLNNFNELESAQNYLIKNSEKRFYNLLGRVTNEEDSKHLGSLITGKLYEAYDEYLSQLTDESRKKAKIFTPHGNSYLEKSYAEIGSDGNKIYGVKKIHDIDKSGAYRLFSFTHMMKETKAMEVDDAFKFTRLTNIVLSENGLNWLADEMSNAVANYQSSKLIPDISLLPENIAVKIVGEDKYSELTDSLFKNKINLKNLNEEPISDGYKFLSKSIIGKNLSYNFEENRLDKNFYGVLDGFNEGLRKEINNFYNFFSDKEKSFDFSLDYLLRNAYQKQINEILSSDEAYNKKINKINNLLETQKSNLKKYFANIKDGNFERINPNNNFLSLFENSEKHFKEFYSDASNKRIIDNFIGFYNQFVISNHNIVKEDFSNNLFSFSTYETKMINEYFSNIYKDSNINFGKLINSYSGENLINFNNIKDISENGFMKFKISSFALDDTGEIVFNQELSSINNIIKNNSKVNKLQNLYNTFDKSEFYSLDESGKLYDKLYKAITSNSKLDQRINTDGIVSLQNIFAKIDDENSLKEYNLFIKNVKEFISLEENSEKIKDKVEILNNIKSYISKSINNMDDNQDIISKEVQKRYNFLIDRKNMDQFIDSIDFSTFKSYFLSDKVFHTADNGNSTIRNKINNLVSVEVKKFIDSINLNVNKGKIVTTTSNIADSILKTDSVLTFTNDGIFNNIIYRLLDNNGNFKTNVSYNDIAESIEKLENSLNLIKDESSINVAKEYLYRSKNFIKNEYLDNYFYGENKLHLTGTNVIKTYNKIKKSIDASYSSSIGNLFTQTISDISKYSPESNLLEKYTHYKVKASATIQGSEGTAINYHIKNYFNELINMDTNVQDYSRKKADFLEAFNVVYGEQRTKKIEKYLNEKSINKLDDFLNSISGIIIGTEEEFKKIKNIYNEFGNAHYTYGFLSRNPHQYVGSVRASRFVKLDEHHRNLSFLKSFIGNENRINNVSPALNFIGKRTALGTNGDFDGDRYQILKFTKDDFKFNKKEKKILSKKINLDSEINYLLNDLSIENLDDIFRDGNNLKYEYKQLYDLIYKRAKLDNKNISSNSDAFEYIRDRYNALKFEYLRSQEVLLDENSQHAELPSIQKLLLKFSNNQNEISRGEFSEFILSLSQEQKREIFYKILSENDIKNLDNIFDIDSNNIEFINKIKKMSKDENIYDVLVELNKEMNKGNLKFNNRWLSDTGYEAYTGIHRTGPVHSALTAIREFSTIVSQSSKFDYVIKEILENNSMYLPEKEIKQKLNSVKKISKKLRFYNTYGTMIEKLSISSKLGGGADPYLNMYQLNKTEALLSNYSNNDNLTKFIDFEKIENISDKLIKDMANNTFEYNGKVIKNIEDIAKMFFIDENSPYFDSDIFESIKQSIAVILNKDFTKSNFDTIDLGINNHTLLSTFSNISLLLSKGYANNILSEEEIVKVGNGLEEVRIQKQINIFDGLRSKIKKSGLLYGITKYFDPNSKNSGLRFETSIKNKFMDFFGIAVEKEINKSEIMNISDIANDSIKTLDESYNFLEEIEKNNNENAKLIEDIKKDFENEINISKFNNVEKNIEGSKYNELKVNDNIEAIDNNKIEKEISDINIYEEKYKESQLEISKLKSEIHTKDEEIKSLKNEISNLNLNYLEKDNSNIDLKELEILRRNAEEIEASSALKIDKANMKIDELTSELENQKKINSELTRKVEDLITKNINSSNDQSKLILQLKEQIAKLQEQNENIINASKKATKAVSDVADGESSNIMSNLSKNKKMLTIGGTVAALGLFFRIFQSNRSVVELDINQKQYEETKGSLYRSLGNYNINTNIRGFY